MCQPPTNKRENSHVKKDLREIYYKVYKGILTQSCHAVYRYLDDQGI